MKIIIPMAGRGSRLRPHTLTLPKPLVPVAGKPMVQRIVEDLASGHTDKIEEVAFVCGDFGSEVEGQLIRIAEKFGAAGKIYYQREPLGVAHAIGCAHDSLNGNVFLAFSDTLFKADFHFDKKQDGIIWVKTVEDPSSFGVVKTNEKGIITDFVEKSPTFVSDMAIVGLYYVREGEYLRDQIRHIIDHDIKDKGEYQITTVLENMKAAGYNFKAQTIDEWLDCGNKQNIVDTNTRMLQIKAGTEQLRAASAVIENSVVIEPCFLGEGAKVINSVIGPHVSVGDHSVVENSIVRNSVIGNDTSIQNARFDNSMLSNKVKYTGRMSDVSIGDFTEVSE